MFTRSAPVPMAGRRRRGPALAIVAAALVLPAGPLAAQAGARPVPAEGRAAPAAAHAQAVTPAMVAVNAASRLGASPAGGSFLLSDARYGAGRVVHGLTAPARWTGADWLWVPAAGMAAAVLVRTTDGRVERYEDARRSREADAYLGAVEPLGELGSFAVVAGLYGGGVVLGRPGLRRTAVEAVAASLVAGGVVTPLLKAAVGRARPRQEEGPYAFAPFSGDKSFPSGHTTQAFAVASVIAAESGSLWVDLLAYGLAGSVGVARVYHDAHFVSDVVVGAAIGTLIGRSMVVADGGGEPAVVPRIGPAGSGGVALGIALSVGGGAQGRMP